MADENAMQEEALESMMAAGYGESEARQAIGVAFYNDGPFADAAALVGVAILHVSLGDIEEDDDEGP